MIWTEKFYPYLPSVLGLLDSPVGQGWGGGRLQP